MKKHTNIKVTDIEIKMDDDDFIISKTDLKGFITYANKTFIEISGYEKSELINVNHNIIRHPDMPRLTFKYMWDLIKNGKDFFGFVKNLRKDGGYYWVFAYISADYDEKNNIIGYTSIRRKPPQEAIDIISSLYKDILTIEADGKKESMIQANDYLNNYLISKNCNYQEFILNLQDN